MKLTVRETEALAFEISNYFRKQRQIQISAIKKNKKVQQQSKKYFFLLQQIPKEVRKELDCNHTLETILNGVTETLVDSTLPPLPGFQDIKNKITILCLETNTVKVLEKKVKASFDITSSGK